MANVYRNDSAIKILLGYEDDTFLGDDVGPVGTNNLTNNNGVVVGPVDDARELFYAGNFEASSNQYLSITNAAQSGLGITGSITAGSWAKFESLSGGTDEGPALLGKYTTSGNQRGYYLRANNTGGSFYPRFTVSGDGIAFTAVQGNTALVTGRWFHLMAVYNGSDLRIFANGLLDADPVAYTAGIFNNTSPFQVGNRGDASSLFKFDGLLDETVVFNRALSEDEVNDIFGNGIMFVPKTYYVNYNTGSNGNTGLSRGGAWKTNSKVSTEFESGNIAPGSIIRWEPDQTQPIATSADRLELRESSGSMSQPIEFVGEGGGARPVFDANGANIGTFVQFDNSEAANWTRRSRFIRIRGFEFARLNNAAVRPTASHHFLVENIYCRDFPNGNSSCFHPMYSAYIIWLRNSIFKNNDCEAVYFGRIHSSVPYDTSGQGYIQNCTMIQNSGEGLDCKENSRLVRLLQCHLKRNGDYGSVGTDQVILGGRWHRAWRNIIEDPRTETTGGIVCKYEDEPGEEGGPAFHIIERNIIRDHSGSNATNGAIRLHGHGHKAVNNTISGNLRGFRLDAAAWSIIKDYLYNNLFEANTHDVFVQTGTTADYHANHNQYDGAGSGTIWRYGGVDRNFSYVQGLGYEAAGLTSSNSYDNDTLYYLSAGAAAINAGLGYESWHDYNNIYTGAGNIDIGWREYDWRNYRTFETIFDTLTPWTSTTGAVSLSIAAKHRDTTGLLVGVTTTPAYCSKTLHASADPLDEGYWRFHINPNNLTAAQGDIIRVMELRTSSAGSVLAFIEIRKSASRWRARAGIIDDAALTHYTAFYDLQTDDFSCIELRWNQAREAGQDTGLIELYIDKGSDLWPTATLFNLNNDARGDCTTFRLGTIGTIPATTTGNLYIAAFAVSAWAYIGPHGPVRTNDGSLQAHWRFDSSGALLTDSSARGNTLTNNNSVGLSRDSYESTGAAQFDAASFRYASITDAAQSGLDLTPPFTIGFDANFDSDGADIGIFSKDPGTGSTGLSYNLKRMTDNRLRFRLANAAGTSQTTFDNDTPLLKEVWYSVRIVADGTDVRFYVHGVLDSEFPTAWTAAVPGNSHEFRLGRRGSEYMGGRLDNFFILNRALNTDEVWWTTQNGIYGVATGAGEAAITFGALTATGAGKVAIAGAAAITLGAMTTTAAGTVGVAGTSAITLGTLAQTGAGTIAIAGQAAITLGVMTSSSAGTGPISGDAAITLGALTSTAAGTVAIVGASAITLGALAHSGAASAAITGSASITFGALTLTATGTLAAGPMGDAAITFGELISEAAGTVAITGASDITFGALTPEGTAAIEIMGAADVTLGEMVLTSAGIVFTPPQSRGGGYNLRGAVRKRGWPGGGDYLHPSQQVQHVDFKGEGLVSDQDFAENIRRLLLSIAILVKKRYNNNILLLILRGDQNGG